VSRAKHLTQLPVECRPHELGHYSSTLNMLSSTGVKLSVPLTAQYVKETAFWYAESQSWLEHMSCPGNYHKAANYHKITTITKSCKMLLVSWYDVGRAIFCECGPLALTYPQHPWCHIVVVIC